MKEFNFFKPYLSSVKKEDKKGPEVFFVTGIVLLAAVLVLSVGAGVYMVRQTDSLKKKIEALEKEVNDPSIQAELAELAILEDEVRTIEAEKLFVDSLDTQFDNMSKVNGSFMDFVANEVVENLYLTSVVIKDTKVEIEGTALNRMGIAQFEYDLRKNGDFVNILVEAIEKQEETEGYEFRMSLEVKEDGAVENQ
ncbi:MAG: PilN domain-containing protein [Peptostreptococcaceae bacterium]|nr:PilN domain-containing protein [Peptostreptococcaceae bacterium]